MTRQDKPSELLPACIVDYIDEVIRRMRYSRSARQEVRQELTDHFTDALADCADPQERQKLTEELIAEFGDTKMLAALLRRAKKRNRPAWEKAIIRTGQTLLLLLVLLGLYTAWFVTGRPTISTNYLAVLSEKRQPKAPEDENAWPLYRQAVLQYVPTPPLPEPDPVQPTWGKFSWPDAEMDPTTLPDVLRRDLRKWIDQNEPAWQAYVAASRKPHCWFARNTMDDLQWEVSKAEAAREGKEIPPAALEAGSYDAVWKDSVMMSLLPPLAQIRHLAKAGIQKAHLAVADGNPREALEDALTVARVAHHWQNPDGYIIEQLVGAATSSLASQEVCRLAANKGLTSTNLRRAQEELEALYPAGYPTFGVEAERLGLADTIQRVFTEGGPGGGHPIPRQAWYATRVAWNNPNEPDLGMTGILTATFLLHAGRDETLAMANAYFDRVAEWSRLTPYQQKGEPWPDQMVMKMQGRLRYTFLHMFLPGLSKASELVRRAGAEYEAAVTVLALQRYRLDKGQYPASLEALAEAGYLRQIPADPYSAGPLVYRRTDDAFTLYSAAGNFADDGGVEMADNPWEGKQQDGRGSDRVFWPVPPLRPFPMEAEPQPAAPGQ